MANELKVVSTSEIKMIKEKLEREPDIFCVEINGIELLNLQSYFDKMSNVFKFPIRSKSFAGYEDWMRDLSWLNKDGYVLIIRNYKDFLKQDPKKKEIVIDEFKNNILPFWEEEVTRTVVGGKAKPFNVYIVDDVEKVPDDEVLKAQQVLQDYLENNEGQSVE